MSFRQLMIRRGNDSSLFPALLVAATTILLVFVRTGLWKYNLFIPIQYRGDAVYFNVIVKTLTDGGWGHYVSRLGMPFGMDSVDFPTAMHLNLVFMKVLGLVIRNPFLLINVFWLTSIGMAGAFAYLFFKWIGIDTATSVCFGILYGLIPFGLFRNVGHLNLVHFMVPPGAYLGVSLARGEVFQFLLKSRALKANYGDSRRFILTLGICAAVGLCYIYWSFFTCITIFLGCVIGYFRFRNVNVPLSACIYIGVIGLAAFGNVSPSLLYWHRNGPNLEAESKAPAQADEYALRIRQMLTPVSTHPIPLIRGIRDKIFAAGFPFDRNEALTAALGMIGTFGFLLLLCAAIAPAPGTILFSPTIRLLAGMLIGTVLVATEGGFGSLFNVFVSHEFRGYNRISPFISLYSLAGLGIALNRLLRTIGPILRHVMLGGIVCFGAFDQVPLDILSGHAAEQRQFEKDGDYIRRLEARVPAAAMIFQLPHTDFPLDVAPNKMLTYDNAKAYLHSQTLRWSWGSMMGRHDNWNRSVAQLPADQFLKKIVLTGFEGILLDRNGFADTKFEEELTRNLEPGSSLDSGFRWIFFDLRPFRKHLQTTFSKEDWKRALQIASASPSTRVEWGGSFSTLETSKEKNWRWCGKQGVIRFKNETSVTKIINVSGQVFVYGPNPYPLSIQRDGSHQQLAVSQDPAAYQDRFTLRPHTVTEIHFEFDGPLLDVPTDPRKLAFQLQNFQWYEEDGNDKAVP